MEKFLKTVEEYKSWKKEIRNVINTDFDKIAELIIDTHGENIFIPISEENSENNMFSPMLKSGVVVNRNVMTNDLYIWFYKNGGFYLIERNDSNALNIQPQYRYDMKYQFVTNSQNFRARFEDEVEFVAALLDWTPTLIEILENRMEKIDPVRARNTIEELLSTAQDT
ncbi:TPA: hypothetical protein NGR42_004525 [Vibrio parahaemolyticus]|uniref:hypothetical protein n=3 Tax=Vibrio harveyi group TaxID=717610 RepID=UPI0031BA0FE5|nr:hypothetical protein [Vibrio parahaemolyticus]HCE3021103.1 hypothetical protein [Vibrio parahaemolyticus]HCE4480051.1 hypothetical protein [Vibrio parahaemolyticus]HCM0830678.1 hypothetical protein [Vibrio parahaemolyticus]